MNSLTEFKSEKDQLERQTNSSKNVVSKTNYHRCDITHLEILFVKSNGLPLIVPFYSPLQQFNTVALDE